MLDRFSSMAAFVATADAGSFAAAAAKLRMSPQMAAKHVMFLEDRLGARLLNRTTRRQSLTELGRRYYDQCKVVLAELAAADRLASDARVAPRGRLRVTAPVTFGSHRLTPLVTRFLQDYPEVEIDLVLTDRPVDLVEEGFEVAFRLGPLADSNLTALALAPYRLIACAAPSYIERHGEPAVPADLAAHECLRWPRPGDDEWIFVRDGEVHRVRVRGRLQTDQGGSVLAAALEGYAVALGAEDLFRQSLAAGRLRQVLPAFEGPTRPLHLLFMPDRRQTPKIAAFIQASVKEFGKQRPNDSR